MNRFPLTSLESYFFNDGEAGSDAMAHAVFDVRSSFDDGVIEKGFIQAMGRQPILSASVVEGGDGLLMCVKK